MIDKQLHEETQAGLNIPTRVRPDFEQTTVRHCLDVIDPRAFVVVHQLGDHEPRDGA